MRARSSRREAPLDLETLSEERKLEVERQQKLREIYKRRKDVEITVEDEPPPATRRPTRARAEGAAPARVARAPAAKPPEAAAPTAPKSSGEDIHPEDSRPMWEEAIGQIPKMWTHEIYPGFEGKYFRMPPREVIPKPVQKPHPPLWVAATQPSTWQVAAQKGIGALGFGISEPGILEGLVNAYKKTIRDCEPVGAFVNDRTAAACICICAPTREEALALGKDTIDFTTRKSRELFTPFANKDMKGYEYYKQMAQAQVALGDYRLSTADLEKRIESGAVMIGDPEDCLRVAKIYESAGVDQLLLLVQVGAVPHEKVMQTIELLARYVMPKVDSA